MEEKPTTGNAKKELNTMEEIFKSYFQAIGCFDYQQPQRWQGECQRYIPDNNKEKSWFRV